MAANALTPCHFPDNLHRSMLRISLRDLRRAGRLRIEDSIPGDNPLWAGTDLVFGGPVRADVTVTHAASGQVLASGHVEAPLVQECRRCLQVVDRTLKQPLELFWSTADELSHDSEGDSEFRVLDPGAETIELGEVIREELALAAPKYPVCDEDCRGLCSRCGTNLNVEECDCVTDEPDPRWDALRALNNQ